jgi:hypothetical protein
MIPLLTVMSTNFEKDFEVLKRILAQLEKRTRMENAYKFSERAEMAAGWWFYDIFVAPVFLQKLFELALPPGTSKDKRSAQAKMVRLLQEQITRNGSEARIKMHSDIPFAGPWWAWLMR